MRPHRGVRDERWKYIRWNLAPSEEELYDLLEDPGERHNLAAAPAHAGQLARLRERLAELRREYGDDDPPEPPAAKRPSKRAG